MGQRKGYKQTAEHIRKRSDNRKNPWIDNPHPRGMLGKKHSEKTKKEYSLKRKNVCKSDEHKEKIRLGHLQRGRGYRLNRGYKIINIGRRKEMSEHRLIWEQHYGKIPKGYIIHHKDENRSNNDINNLQLLTTSQHAELHSSERKRDKLGRWHSENK